MKEYYQLNEKATLIAVNGSLNPLNDEEVARSRAKYGRNELGETKNKSIIYIFFSQFKDFLVIILLVAAGISALIGEGESALVIFAVTLLNAILGTVQTVKAEASLNSLKKMASPMAKVLRNNEIVMLPAWEVVVGDIVYLDAGDYVPSDGRLLTLASLKVDESALTGESIGVDKALNAIKADNVPLAERFNMVYAGTFVTNGRGSYVVTTVGMNTEVGKIAGLIKNAEEKKTPLQVNLDIFGKKLSLIVIALCGILLLLSVLKGDNIVDAFLFAIALAVAAIPEALSSIVTIVLSIGTQKMAKEKAIVRKLQAVEGLGSVSVICSDKTGTLTQNKMTIEAYYVDHKKICCSTFDQSDALLKKLITYSILCNDAKVNDEEKIGDPTEIAMLEMAKAKGIDTDSANKQYPRIAEIPFDSGRKMMTTLNEFDSEKILIVKGACDVLLKKVTKIAESSGIRLIDDEDISRISRQSAVFSASGLRVLALAYKPFKGLKLDYEDEKDLIFLGLIAMMDPPRTESKAAVQACKEAHINAVMITGDHLLTAKAIADKIGILTPDKKAVEGAEIDHISDEELADFVKDVAVYARVTPEHKIRIVKAWQANGAIVAMTGDGVNDAPALKQADIGVAMGITGSEVAKDASAMILADDNFATIVKAIENGRNIYRNIKNAIQFLLSGNFAAILAVLFASVMLLPLPFAPVHLLFINLLTDSLPAIALGLEPGSDEVMKEKPRPQNESILTRSFLLRIGLDGLAIAIFTMIAYFIGYQDDTASAMTMAFAVLCLSRLFHGFSSKSYRPLIFNKCLFNNSWLIGAFFIGFSLLSLVILFPGLATIFAVKTLDLSSYCMVVVLAFASFLTVQSGKSLLSKINKDN